MKKLTKKNGGQDILPEYDFSSGIRGKYTKRFQEGTNVVILDQDVAKVFHDRTSINAALRALVKIIHRQEQKA